MLTQIWSSCTGIIFLSFQVIFCFFVPLLTPKIKIWKKCKKIPERIILLHMCTINQYHMMYGSWDMKFNWRNSFVILGYFLPFTLLTPWKMKISKMKKKLGDIIILHKCTKNHDHLLYCSRDTVHVRCNCYFHIGLSDIFPSTFL